MILKLHAEIAWSTESRITIDQKNVANDVRNQMIHNLFGQSLTFVSSLFFFCKDNALNVYSNRLNCEKTVLIYSNVNS